MECKYVRQTNCICFLFHPNNTSLLTLVQHKNRLKIMQENLYTGLIINQFIVPLKQGKLQVDNYSLVYNQTHDYILLTFFHYILVYSVHKKKMLMFAEMQGKNPYSVEKIVSKGQYAYFSASQQRNIYSIHILDSVKNGSVTNYNKFKISAEAEVIDLAISERVLIAICNDMVLRIWNLQNGNLLKGAAIQGVGMPRCLHFSKNMSYLLIGTSDGFVQAWDGKTLGIQNTNLMSQRITNFAIQSVSWFHYCGQSQSNRFLSFTEDGSIKLYSFWFDKKNNSTYIAKANELSLLYANKHKILDSFMINSHSYSNFIFFSPGVLLYMVDNFPLIYYPIITKQPSISFEQMTPNHKKQIYYQRDIIFMQGMNIKRIQDTIEDKVILSNDIEYSGLKVVKLETRPISVSSPPEKSKILLFYYLSKSYRAVTTSNINMNQKTQTLPTYKQYNGSWVMFIGPQQYYEPLIFIVQQDKQTIMIAYEGQHNDKDSNKYSQQQKRYFTMGINEIYQKKINIKIQRVYLTPFRDSYVVLYQSENLLRFSNNINYDTQLMNYEVYTGLSLRLDYTEIILDVIWTTKGEMGAVVCLDKVILINSDLKIMRSVYINGYVIQGQWIGYTILITTKKDVQYLDILSKPQQAYCLENMQKKYLVLKVMADRIFGIQREGQNVLVKARYFNIMEMLVLGYLNYQKVIEAPIDQQTIKRIIECYAPYFIVNQEFIELLNQRNLTKISKYFIEGNQGMYSRPLRAKVLNDSFRIERFVPSVIWGKNKRLILDLFLSYEESKDSTDPYEKQKGQKIGEKLKNLIGSIAFDSIKNITMTEARGITIQNNFGEKSLIQLYYDISKEGQKLRMEIEPFKAEDTGQWLGHFQNYIESHFYYAEDASEGEKQVVANLIGDQSEEESEDQGQFNDLIIYYRIDDGKGTIVDDLSDYDNQGAIQQQTWVQLEDEPMQLEDKWGKKCPVQYSLSSQITTLRKIKTRKIKDFSLEIWLKPMNQNFFLLDIHNMLNINFVGMEPVIRLKDQEITLKDSGSEEKMKPSIGNWIHFSCTFSLEEELLQIFYNSNLMYSSKTNAKKLKKPQNLLIGDKEQAIQFTEFRFWKKTLQQGEILENMRTPLSIVAEKRKALKAKIRKQQTSAQGFNPQIFEL